MCAERLTLASFMTYEGCGIQYACASSRFFRGRVLRCLRHERLSCERVGCSRGVSQLTYQTKHRAGCDSSRSEEHTSELQSHHDLVCRLLLEKKKQNKSQNSHEI